VIATTPEHGVVDTAHRVYASADGDVHETCACSTARSCRPTRVNPSLTITALAERAMSLR